MPREVHEKVRQKLYSQCKGPEVGLCPAYLRNSKEAGVAGAKTARVTVEEVRAGR